MAQIDFPSNPFHGQSHRVPEIAASYIYDRTRDSWYFAPVSGTGGGGSGGGAGVTISELPPSVANNGDLWIESTTYYLHVYDGTVANDTGRWIGITNNGGDNTMVHMDPVPPTGNVSAGQMWFDTEVGDLRVLYTDPDSSQWVTITSNGQSLGVTSNIIRLLQSEIDDLNEKLNQFEGQLDDIQTNSINLED